VHFVGSISSANLRGNVISVTWAILPGSRAWAAKNGTSCGESHSTTVSSYDGISILSHPIDVQYEVSSSEGWPVFTCEVWERSPCTEAFRGFVGCGSCWLPTSGRMSIDIPIWKPSSVDFVDVEEMVLPTCPDLRKIRELSISPFLRSQMETKAIGTVHLELTAITCGFHQFGIKFNIF